MWITDWYNTSKPKKNNFSELNLNVCWEKNWIVKMIWTSLFICYKNFVKILILQEKRPKKNCLNTSYSLYYKRVSYDSTVHGWGFNSITVWLRVRSLFHYNRDARTTRSRLRCTTHTIIVFEMVCFAHCSTRHNEKKFNAPRRTVQTFESDKKKKKSPIIIINYSSSICSSCMNHILLYFWLIWA